ncbi:PREDICTED: hornerin [Chrysochloris asiatica]|uniref:Hornerin n=1 Tax=Chrysochloris asiatica TaxID=185453 RepID=A0A9B0TI33_CHRAS|nr:PREDICTED: hornerin [Chrysochloris asiatica]
MSQLLQNIISIIELYYQYAAQDGECDKLNKAELKELLENEFHQILKNPDDPDTVDVIMLSLDQDRNKKVDFTEYLVMIFKLAQACNKIIGKDHCQASGSKQKNHRYQYQEEQSETEEEKGKALGKGESQVQDTPRVLGKTSMALISQKDLTVEKMMTFIQANAE